MSIFGKDRIRLRISICAISFWLASCGNGSEIQLEEIEKEEDPFEGPSWEVPQGWLPGKDSNMRVGSYLVKDANGSALDISVSRIDHLQFPGAGELLPNVNRWLGQIELAPVDKDGLDQYVRDYSIADKTGTWVDATNEGQRMVGVILKLETFTWFFKMIGNSALSEKEEKSFEFLLNSIRIVGKPKEVNK